MAATPFSRQPFNIFPLFMSLFSRRPLQDHSFAVPKLLYLSFSVTIVSTSIVRNDL